MKAVEFCYWLQGFFEINRSGAVLKTDDPPKLSSEQVATIQAHLALVFKHEIDPGYSADPKVQEQLQAIHDGVKALKKKRPPRPEGGGSFGPSGSDVVYRC